MLAGIVWALENPKAGIVETDEIDFKRCLEVQQPYLGNLKGIYTDWHPLKDRLSMFPRERTRKTHGSSATFWYISLTRKRREPCFRRELCIPCDSGTSFEWEIMRKLIWNFCLGGDAGSFRLPDN